MLRTGAGWGGGYSFVGRLNSYGTANFCFTNYLKLVWYIFLQWCKGFESSGGGSFFGSFVAVAQIHSAECRVTKPPCFICSLETFFVLLVSRYATATTGSFVIVRLRQKKKKSYVRTYVVQS